MSIVFNRPTIQGRELEYMSQVLNGLHTSGNGPFTERAQGKISELLGGGKVLLTTSCTAALEMAGLLVNLAPGDEVIMPSYTFTSTANAVVMRGAIPVFVDIRPDTLNIDERLIEEAITPRTKAIMVVHYAGVGCNMQAITAIASRHRLSVIEDAAQALCATLDGRPLGRDGQLAAFSFHETKNVVAGECGALVINDEALIERAEVIWEKGTNRIKFKRGEVSKYNWVDIGGSYLPNELTAAFLFAQLEKAEEITAARIALWSRYRNALLPLAERELITLPDPLNGRGHNGHIFYLLAPNARLREAWLADLASCGIGAIIHYVPLHSAPAGRKFGRTGSAMTVTDDIASRLIRLPLHMQLAVDQQDTVISAIKRLAGSKA